MEEKEQGEEEREEEKNEEEVEEEEDEEEVKEEDEEEEEEQRIRRRGKRYVFQFLTKNLKSHVHSSSSYQGSSSPTVHPLDQCTVSLVKHLPTCGHCT